MFGTMLKTTPELHLEDKVSNGSLLLERPFFEENQVCAQSGAECSILDPGLIGLCPYCENAFYQMFICNDLITELEKSNETKAATSQFRALIEITFVDGMKYYA
ncbi:hypothetical protein ABG067_001547 [Albugo candida]